MQDTAAYKDQFLAEAKDQITKINTLLISLEKEPDNIDFINEIFRFCHTLKGNSAAMGYKKYSDLAHSAENLLGKVRSKELKVTPAVQDALFKAADLLDEGLDLVRDDRESELSTEEVDKELASLTGGKTVLTKKFSIAEKFPLTSADKVIIRKKLIQGLECLRVVVVFKKGSNFKKAKSRIIKRDVEKISKMLFMNPPFDKMTETNFNEFEFIVAVKPDKKDMIKTALSRITELWKYFLVDWKETINPDMIKVEAPKIFAKVSRSIRIDITKLDHLLNLVGELLTSNLRLKKISERLKDKELFEVIYKLELVSRELQDEVMIERMLPLNQMFSKFPRIIRDLANQAGKKVNIIIEGEDVEIDRTVFEEIGDPMMHLMRNAIDHGIEMPDVRKKLGKNPEGLIRIIAKRGRDTATIEIIDDGGGIDPDKVKKSAVKKGFITQTEADTMSDHEAQRLIFRQGVSTAEKVTSVSGRGVGMDVVQSKISSYGGFIKLVSKPGEGTSFTLHVPLTMAIIKALLVKVQDFIFAIPLTNLSRTVHLKSEQIKSIQMEEVIILDGRQVPVVRLDDVFGIPGERKESNIAVLVEKEDKPVALLADSVFNEQEILIKSLGKIMKGVKGIAGATILGDGNLCLILDVVSLI